MLLCCGRVPSLEGYLCALTSIAGIMLLCHEVFDVPRLKVMTPDRQLHKQRFFSATYLAAFGRYTSVLYQIEHGDSVTCFAAESQPHLALPQL